MSMTVIAGMAIVLAVLASTRLAASRRSDRAFEIVESRRRRGSGTGLFVLVGAGLCAGMLFAGYRWLPAEQSAQVAVQGEMHPTLRLAESFDSYREMQQNTQQAR